MNSIDNVENSPSPRLKTQFTNNTAFGIHTEKSQMTPNPMPKIANIKKFNDGPWENTKGVPIHFNHNDKSGLSLAEKSFNLQQEKNSVKY